MFYWIWRCGAWIKTVIKNSIHIVNPKFKPFSIINKHFHGPDPQFLQIKKFKQGIKRKSDKTNDTESRIYQESIKCCLIKRWRIGKECKEPKSISKIIILETRQYITLDNKLFLINSFYRSND